MNDLTESIKNLEAEKRRHDEYVQQHNISNMTFEKVFEKGQIHIWKETHDTLFRLIIRFYSSTHSQHVVELMYGTWYSEEYLYMKKEYRKPYKWKMQLRGGLQWGTAAQSIFAVDWILNKANEIIQTKPRLGVKK